MTELSGQDALDQLDQDIRRDAERVAKRLEEAKAAALPRGKEPFDLAQLETLCDTSHEGRIDPVEERQRTYEYMYYVQHPEYLTLQDLAEHVRELAEWA